MDVATQRQGLAGFAVAQAVAFEQLGHHHDADAEAQQEEFLGNLGAGQVGPQDAVLVGVTGGAGVEDPKEGSVEAGEEAQAASASTPFFRA